MFTGIIDHCGTIMQIQPLQSALRLWIKHSFTELSLGESIAVDGICLTVTEFHDNLFCCDLSPETLHLTTAKSFKVNQLVNLERALQLSSRIGGHFVMGHIDQTLHVKKITQIGDFTEIQFSGLDELSRKFVIKKGSIAINGVSLTINAVADDGFSMMLIPHTLERTNLQALQVNDDVNIEFDMLARMFAEQCERYMREIP